MKKKFMNLLNTLSKDEMRTINGGYGDPDCTGFGTNKCNADCPCTDAADWCVSGLCQTRP